MKWKTYRTRFLVKAKQLNSNLSFIDALGRHHSGRNYVAMPMGQRGAFVGLAETEPVCRKAPQPYRERRGTGLQLM